MVEVLGPVPGGVPPHPRAAAPPPPAARGVRRVGACPVCELSQQPRFAEHVRGWRAALVGLEAPARVEVGVAACSHHCNHTLVHEIAVVARRHGYSVAIGGKGDGIPRTAEWLVEGVPRGRVQPLVEHVLATYRRLARGRERLSRVVARVGVEPFLPADLHGGDGAEAAAAAPQPDGAGTPAV